MYRVYAGSLLLYSDTIENLKIFDAKATLELNKTGSFSFKIYPDHPYYNFIYKLKTIITVYQDDFLLFRGRVLNDNLGFRNEKTIECEGELAFLIDSIQRPYSYSGSIAGFLNQLISAHNSQVEAEHQFTLGEVTVTDPNNTIARSSIDYTDTWTVINDKLINLLGGYISVRRVNGVSYIDYLQDFNLLSSQKVEFAKNLLDMKRLRKGEQIATALIPLGAKLKDEEGQETDERLTIASVNEGKDYIFDADAVNRYGWICKTNIWDDVTQPLNLLTKGRTYLAELANATETIELSAADLATIDKTVNSFHLGTYVKVTSNPHGVDQNFLVTKLSISLLQPASNKLTLGGIVKSFTESINENKPVDGKNGKNGVDGKDGKDAAIQSDTEPTDKTYMWLDTSQDPPVLKRWNGEEWEIINDTTAITESIAILSEQTSATIAKSNSEILQTVSEQYYLKTETDQLISSKTSEWEQTANGFRQRFTTIEKDIDDVVNGTDSRFNELHTYIDYSTKGIELGSSNSNVKVLIDNDSLDIVDNGSVVATFANNRCYTPNLIVEYGGSLQLGDFAFFPRNNGNLSFKKIT